MKLRERERMFENLHNETGVSSEEYYMAYKRVKRIKGFYVHFIVYVLVNSFMVIGQCYDAESIRPLFQLHTFSTAFFWGIGLVAHGISVFGKDIFFGDNWEEKKIKQLMEREKRNKME